LKISYGSLKESEYLVEFAKKRGWIERSEADQLISMCDQIGKMLWGVINNADSGN
jgi:four helix bundle protein